MKRVLSFVLAILMVIMVIPVEVIPVYAATSNDIKPSAAGVIDNILNKVSDLDAKKGFVGNGYIPQTHSTDLGKSHKPYGMCTLDSLTNLFNRRLALEGKFPKTFFPMSPDGSMQYMDWGNTELNYLGPWGETFNKKRNYVYSYKPANKFGSPTKGSNTKKWSVGGAEYSFTITKDYEGESIDSDDMKQELMDLLDKHPEGIWLYNQTTSGESREEHAVVVTGYNSKGDLYAIDPVKVAEDYGSNKKCSIQSDNRLLKKTSLYDTNNFTIAQIGYFTDAADSPSIKNHSHSYKTNDKGHALCTVCGKEYPDNVIGICSDIKTNNKAKFYNRPYTFGSGLKVAEGKVFEVDAYMINAYGNKWYRIKGTQNWICSTWGTIVPHTSKINTSPIIADSPSTITTEANPDKYNMPTTTLKYSGSGAATCTGNGVRWVQCVLIQLGYSVKNDGSYGPATKSAVQKFQKNNGLEVDGKVGPATRAKLNLLWQATKNKTSTLGISAVSSSYTINEKSKLTINGKITSNYAINKVEAYISGNGKPYAQFNPNKMEVNLANTAVSTASPFPSCAPGTYTLKIVATDTSGSKKEIVSTVTIKTVVNAPKISVANGTECKVVMVSQSTVGSALKYRFTGNSSDYKVLSSSTSQVKLEVKGTGTVEAWEVKNNVQSNITKNTVYVNRLISPKFSTSANSHGTVVTIQCQYTDGTIYYSIGGGAAQKYTGAILLTKQSSVSAWVSCLGSLTSEKTTETFDVFPPQAPAIESPVANYKSAANKEMMVRWSNIGNAGSYIIRVYEENIKIHEYTANNPYSIITLDGAGTYELSVQAVNDIGSSSESNRVSYTAVDPSKVRFEDFDGSLISEVMVPYGYAVESPQKDPERRGYDFTGWTIIVGSGKQSEITEDTVIRALYKKKTYIVSFFDQYGQIIGDKQKVLFENSAESPENQLQFDEGYAFLGWSITATEPDSACDITCVDSNMTAKAIIGWGEPELPIISKVLNAKYQDGFYNISVGFVNTPDHDTDAVARVTLKTSKDKVVVTRIIPLYLVKDTTYDTSSAKYNADNKVDLKLKTDSDASIVEVTAFEYSDKNGTGSALSLLQSAKIQAVGDYTYGEWTEWSTTPLTGYDDSKTKTQYQYRDKQYTSSSASSLSGWTKYNTTSYYSGWSGWTGWSTTPVTASSTVEVEKKTQYRYYRCHCNVNYNHDWYGNVSYCYGHSTCKGKTSVYEYVWTDTPTSVAAKWPAATDDGKARRTYENGIYWYYHIGATGSHQTTTRTVYRYRTRSLCYTYYYWKWGNWTNWQDAAVTASSDREVGRRTLYSYRKKNVPVYSDILAENEDNSGVVYTFTNKEEHNENDYYVPNALPSIESVDLNGKLATVMVYKGKNTDPNESQLQYIGQIRIGENNTFSATFMTKNPPTVESGDYIVALGIQGSTGLINIGMIDAPKPVYTVTYKDDLGNVLKEEQVAEGGKSSAPEVPNREGATFVGWSDNGMDIYRDTIITAYFTPVQCAVTFIDWVNGEAYPYICDYGTPISEIKGCQIKPSAEGYTFIGWDFEPGTIVKDNTIISAKYETEKFKVIFVDADEKIVSEQMVAYGDCAQLPDDLEAEDMFFLGWETDEENPWWEVKSNVVVHPIFEWKEITAEPVIITDQEFFIDEMTIILDCEEDATIYYALNGEDPYENGIEYSNEGITITEDTYIAAYAKSDHKRDSYCISYSFYLSEETNDEQERDIIPIGEYNIPIEGRQQVDISINIKDNPGITKSSLILNYDSTAYHMLFDDDGLLYSCDEVLPGGYLTVDPFAEDACEIETLFEEPSVDNGTLIKLSFVTSDVLDEGQDTYPIGLSYVRNESCAYDNVSVDLENCIDISYQVFDYTEPIEENTEETNQSTEETTTTIVATPTRTTYVDVGTMDVSYGDMNMDNSVDMKDLLMLRKFVAGVENISNGVLADVNQDGSIDMIDILQLRKAILGSISLPTRNVNITSCIYEEITTSTTEKTDIGGTSVTTTQTISTKTSEQTTTTTSAPTTTTTTVNIDKEKISKMNEDAGWKADQEYDAFIPDGDSIDFVIAGKEKGISDAKNVSWKEFYNDSLAVMDGEYLLVNIDPLVDDVDIPLEDYSLTVSGLMNGYNSPVLDVDGASYTENGKIIFAIAGPLANTSDIDPYIMIRINNRMQESKYISFKVTVSILSLKQESPQKDMLSVKGVKIVKENTEKSIQAFTENINCTNESSYLVFELENVPFPFKDSQQNIDAVKLYSSGKRIQPEIRVKADDVLYENTGTSLSGSGGLYIEKTEDYYLSPKQASVFYYFPIGEKGTFEYKVNIDCSFQELKSCYVKDVVDQNQLELNLEDGILYETFSFCNGCYQNGKKLWDLSVDTENRKLDWTQYKENGSVFLTESASYDQYGKIISDDLKYPEENGVSDEIIGYYNFDENGFIKNYHVVDNSHYWSEEERKLDFIYHTNSEGYIMYSKDTYENHYSIPSFVPFYNEKGQLSYETVYSWKDDVPGKEIKMSSIYVHSYDKNGNRTGVKGYNENGELIHEEVAEYQYDENQNCIAEIWYLIPVSTGKKVYSSKYMYEYDANGNLLKKYDQYGQTVQYVLEEYQYDSENRLIYMKDRPNTRGDIREREYKYDTNGKLDSIVEQIGNVINYYDANENLISRAVVGNNTTTYSVTTKKIPYYRTYIDRISIQWRLKNCWYIDHPSDF